MRKVLLNSVSINSDISKKCYMGKVTDRSTIQEGKVYFIVSYDKKYYYMMNEYSDKVIDAIKFSSPNCDIYINIILFNL